MYVSNNISKYINRLCSIFLILKELNILKLKELKAFKASLSLWKNCNDGEVYEVFLGLKPNLIGEYSIVRQYLIEVTPS